VDLWTVDGHDIAAPALPDHFCREMRHRNVMPSDDRTMFTGMRGEDLRRKPIAVHGIADGDEDSPNLSRPRFRIVSPHHVMGKRIQVIQGSCPGKSDIRCGKGQD
jgi:hypothetical protein